LKYIEEYRDKQLVYNLVNQIKKEVTRSWTIMEICGGQTHSIMKYNLQDLLPEEINLVHGPGCPVCVTPLELIDQALTIASKENVIFTSFGDMLRVPGSSNDLLSIKAKGADIRILYSPIDALKIAKENPEKRVVFFSVGFETTAPAVALALKNAKKQELNNFSVLIAHVLVPPAMETILSSEQNQIQGFLAAGHVCTIMGYHEYWPISEKYKIPIVITGFEPVDILLGLLKVVKLLEGKKNIVENAYGRIVAEKGNESAQKLLREVFEVTDRKWRGIGTIPKSGYRLRKEYEQFNAESIFNIGEIKVEESDLCIAGEVLQGIKKPNNCSVFGTLCNPENPIGAPMVSSEGACSAYYKYKRLVNV